MKAKRGGILEPWWARLVAVIGVNGFLVLYLLGAIPGMPSPIMTIQSSLQAHGEETRDTLRVLRMVCRGVWKDVPEMQEQCGK